MMQADTSLMRAFCHLSLVFATAVTLSVFVIPASAYPKIPTGQVWHCPDGLILMADTDGLCCPEGTHRMYRKNICVIGHCESDNNHLCMKQPEIGCCGASNECRMDSRCHAANGAGVYPHKPFTWTKNEVVGVQAKDISGSCKDNKCMNKGKCIAKPDGYTCDCPKRTHGEFCDLDCEAGFYCEVPDPVAEYPPSMWTALDTDEMPSRNIAYFKPVQCPENHYCPPGTSQPIPCKPSERCPAGSSQPQAGSATSHPSHQTAQQ